MNNNKETKYIKRYLENFIGRFHPKQITADVVDILVSFVKYERINNYCHQVVLSVEHSSEFAAVTKEFISANPEGSIEDFSLGLKVAATILENKLAHLNYAIETERNSLSNQKRKNAQALYNFKTKLAKLEHNLNQSEANVTQKMALAYKAGQNSCEIVAKNTLTGTPVFFIKRYMNFKKWANQIWKYGKFEKQPFPPIMEQELVQHILHQLRHG